MTSVVCPFDCKNEHFRAWRWEESEDQFVVGCLPAFNKQVVGHSYAQCASYTVEGGMFNLDTPQEIPSGEAGQPTKASGGKKITYSADVLPWIQYPQLTSLNILSPAGRNEAKLMILVILKHLRSSRKQANQVAAS
jgi:hypothetical protein